MGKYYSFNGLAKRQEYWGVILLSALIHTIATLLVLGLTMSVPGNEVVGLVLCLPLMVSGLWVLLGTSARRCRDIGINPWWCVAQIVPYISIVTFFVFGILKSAEPE